MPYDIHYNSVLLLLHADGPNNSTTFTDSSATPKTVTPYGNAKISVAQSKFGGSSAYFDGAGSYLNAPGSQFTLPGDFTIELFLRVEGSGDNRYCNVLQTRDGANNGWLIQYDRTSKLISFASDAGLTGLQTASNAIVDGVWYHVAVSRVGSDIYFFLDGALTASTSSAQNFNASNFYISRRFANDGAWHYFNGYIDEVRITKGVGRYTSSFSAPSQEFSTQLPKVLGTIKDTTGAGVSRTVRAYRRDTGALLGETTSAANGQYEIAISSFDGETQIVALDDNAGTLLNDVILRTFPV